MLRFKALPKHTSRGSTTIDFPSKFRYSQQNIFARTEPRLIQIRGTAGAIIKQLLIGPERSERPEPIARDGSGNTIDPTTGVVPVLKELERGKLSVKGTAFYITRYGVFMTAAHVLKDLIDTRSNALGVAYLCHSNEEKEKTIHFRRIQAINFHKHFDIAIGQANNWMDRFPQNPLKNRTVRLTIEEPKPKAPLTTYAYPENNILDFTGPAEQRILKGGFFQGECITTATKSEYPQIPYPHYQTTTKIQNGASGAPAFCERKVIGINSRAFEFEGDEWISYVTPIAYALEMELGGLQIPPESWEYKQLPKNLRNADLRLEDLAKFGHVTLHGLIDYEEARKHFLSNLP